MRNDKDTLIVRLSLEFALKTIAYAELLDEKKKYLISKQLLKSGTSIGANMLCSAKSSIHLQIFKLS